MQIIHRISIASSPKIQRELADLGVTVSDHGFVSFEVVETDETWSGLRAWITHRRALDVATTKFSKQELSDARWLEILPDWHHGYPQPNEDEFGFRQVTYDLSGWCEVCGIGKKQKAPFQMKAEPKWGRNGILQLNWVFDEYLVRPEVWAGLNPLGVASRPVTNAQGVELATVVQLVVEAQVPIKTEGLAFERCRTCGRVKYLPVTRGPFPALAVEPSEPIARTTDYFGSGAQAHRRVIISHVLARSLASAQVRGVSLRPVHLLDGT